MFVPQSSRQSIAPVLNSPPTFKNFHEMSLNSLMYLIVGIIIIFIFFYLHSGGWNQGPLDTAAT
jgi:hypothetical protein